MKLHNDVEFTIRDRLEAMIPERPARAKLRSTQITMTNPTVEIHEHEKSRCCRKRQNMRGKQVQNVLEIALKCQAVYSLQCYNNLS